MTTFVLVPGAWLGAWAWERVAPLLETAGHSVHPVTLAGLSERSTGSPEGITLDTHAADVVSAVEAHEGEIVLVSHSYSGLPVQQAVDALGARVSAVVHVDSAVASAGAFLDGEGEWVVQTRAAVEAAGGWWLPDSPQFEGQGFSDDDLALMVQRCTPHPGGSLTSALHLDHPDKQPRTTYLHCLHDSPELDPDIHQLARAWDWQVEHLEAGHWPMLTAPELLADALLAQTG